jgi:hypothetical protein
VFIYETLCQMPVEIIKGDTFEVMRSLAPKKVRTFFSVDTKIKELTQQLSEDYDLEVINLKPFVKMSDGYKYKRFLSTGIRPRRRLF